MTCRAISRLLFFAILASLAFSQRSSAQSSTLTVLYSFCNQAQCADGQSPQQSLVQGSDGEFYGVTNGGNGTLFKADSAGNLTVLNSFCSGGGSCPEGIYPKAPLIQGPDGNLYSTTPSGGADTNDGIFYQITPSGSLTVIHSFCQAAGICTDGGSPESAPVLGSDGNYYGVNLGSGANGRGIIYQLTPAGVITNLHDFCGKGGSNCTDGAQALSALVEGPSKTFYGTTSQGGLNQNAGTIFSITSSGTYTVLYSFCSASSCADGMTPGNIVMGPNGILYGTTYAGGSKGDGVVFSLTSSGTYSVLYSICSQTFCTDGKNPASGLLLASDGNLYGATTSGGANDYGALFEVTPAGAFTTLYSFCSASSCTDGDTPHAAPIQGSDGNFYGTADAGGANSSGVLYKLALASPLPPAIKLTLSKSSVAANTPVTLSWSAAYANSVTSQQCYAFVQGNPSGAGTWSGKQTGTFSSSTHAYSGSASITPTTRRNLHLRTHLRRRSNRPRHPHRHRLQQTELHHHSHRLAQSRHRRPEGHPHSHRRRIRSHSHRHRELQRHHHHLRLRHSQLRSRHSRRQLQRTRARHLPRRRQLPRQLHLQRLRLQSSKRHAE